jgi:hypothetical protein
MAALESALLSEHDVGYGGRASYLHLSSRSQRGLAHPAGSTSDLALAATASGAALSISAFALPTAREGDTSRKGMSDASTTSLLESGDSAFDWNVEEICLKGFGIPGLRTADEGRVAAALNLSHSHLTFTFFLSAFTFGEEPHPLDTSHSSHRLLEDD